MRYLWMCICALPALALCKPTPVQPTITPAAAPYVTEGSDVFVTFDFIWWKMALFGIAYAYTGTADDGTFVPFGTSTRAGSVKTPSLRFEPGFKVGLGVNFEHDGWDLYANYTILFGPNGSNSIAASSGKGAISLLPTQLNTGVPTSLLLAKDNCKWNQEFNVIDLELGRNFFLSQCLTMRPFAGLKTSWLLDKATFTLIPANQPPDGPPGNTVEAVQSLRSQRLWGLGIRAGMNTGWYITKHWSIYADFAITTLWSDFHIKNSDTVTETHTGQTKTQATKQTLQIVIPVFETGLGLAYATWWDQNRYRFEMRAGWEEQIWSDYNNFMYTGQESGSLTVHGLTAKWVLTF